MNKLKTLKDMKVKIDDITKANELSKKIPDINGITGDVIFYEDLKAEAVKWVKECEKCDEHDERLYWVDFIKHFFNLTEEDLEVQND